MTQSTTANWYGILAIAAIVVSAIVWSRTAERGAPHRGAMAIIYLAGLAGGFIGSKLAYLFAEGWGEDRTWLALVTGRSVTGALLGGYATVELMKRLLGVREATGDFFAVAAPVGIALGRIGCMLQGCCQGVACDAARWPAWLAGQSWLLVDDAHGVARWPSAQIELAFNVVFVGWALAARRFEWVPGNRFHVYLIAYGAFRFLHEFLRDIPPMMTWGGASSVSITGYQVVSLAMIAFGAVRFVQRRRNQRRGDRMVEPSRVREHAGLR